MVSNLHIKYSKRKIDIVIKKYLWKGIRFLHAAKLRFDGEGITMASCASVHETGVEDDGIIVQHHARSKKSLCFPLNNSASSNVDITCARLFCRS